MGEKQDITFPRITYLSSQVPVGGIILKGHDFHVTAIYKLISAVSKKPYE